MAFNNNQIFSIKESRNQGIKTKNASQQNSDKGNAAQASSNKNDVNANVKNQYCLHKAMQRWVTFQKQQKSFSCQSPSLKENFFSCLSSGQPFFSRTQKIDL